MEIITHLFDSPVIRGHLKNAAVEMGLAAREMTANLAALTEHNRLFKQNPMIVESVQLLANRLNELMQHVQTPQTTLTTILQTLDAKAAALAANRTESARYERAALLAVRDIVATLLPKTRAKAKANR